MKKLLLFILLTPLILFSQTQIGQDINGENADDRSGQGVSISADGTVVAIGAYMNNGNGNQSGHVRIFENIGGVWTQVGGDIDGEAAEDTSGTAISLSANGKIIAIGAPRNDGNGPTSGHVRVYENIGGVWTQIGQDIDGESAGDNSGLYLSMSDSGNIVAIGAYFNDGDNSTDMKNGQVRIFENIDNTWIQIGNDIDGMGGDRFGQAVSLSADGKIFAASTPFGGSLSTGGFLYSAIKVYENVGGNWAQIGSNIESDQAGDGSRVTALSADGKIIAIGAPSYHAGSLAEAGRVRIFEIIDGVWTQLGSDINGDNAGDGAGFGLDISSDGTIVAVGAINNNVVNLGAGQVKVFKFTAGDWAQIGTDIYGETPSDGSCILSLSKDGSTLAIGAPENDGNGKKSGHVRVFDLSTILSVNSYVSSNLNLFPNPSRNEVRINLGSNLELHQATIYSILGQKIKTVTQTVIDISEVPNGIYLVDIITNKGKAVKKLVKK